MNLEQLILLANEGENAKREIREKYFEKVQFIHDPTSDEGFGYWTDIGYLEGARVLFRLKPEEPVMKKSRKLINVEIINILSEANATLGDQRFGQLLINLGFTKDFELYGDPLNHIDHSEESQVTLDRITGFLDNLKKVKNG